MSDGFDDGFRDDDENAISHSNIRKIPKNKTAVALKESEGGKKVPKLAAAGRGAIAEKILQLAYENGIDVREDSDLAELLAKIEIDSPIPSEAFIAVGEILSYVYRANGQENPFDTLLNDDTQILMDVISPDLPQFLKLIIALGVVLLLMGGLVMVLKMLGLSPQTSVKSGDKRRLQIVESLPLDARRRAVILKCDNKEHLVILNANGETVIENDIPPVDYSPDSNQDA